MPASPRTAAGRTLRDVSQKHWDWLTKPVILDAIFAIEAEAAQQQSAPAGTDSQAAPLDVEALADALHHVMCKVSHHDSNFRERSCFASFPLIARAVHAHLVQERSE